jgi:pyruvate formate lyase activating enzyme
MIRGRVFNIQRGSIHDGPGIRTTVFLKGCTLRCLWCHNPESIDQDSELIYNSEKCISCLRCIDVCPNNCHSAGEERRTFSRTHCTACGECASVCPAEALENAGYIISAEDAAAEAARDIPFYRNSGGGVTVSGGEPLMQPGFTESLLVRCRNRGIHTAVDTAGNVPWSAVQQVLPCTDLFLFDVKAADPELHRRLTGSPNGRILSNLKTLTERQKSVIIRIPVIPGQNDIPGEMERIAVLLSDLGIDRAELLPYHRTGTGKYRNLGKADPLEGTDPCPKARIDELKGIFEKRGITV